MSPFFRNAIASLIAVPILLFIGWVLSQTPLNDDEFQSRVPKKEIKNISLGWDRRAGNLLIVQLDFKPEYFSREDRLRNWLEEPLLIANEKGWLQKSTLVVYPPEIGNYLFLLDSRKEILDSSTESSAWDWALFFKRVFPNRFSYFLSEESSSFAIAEEANERYQRIFGSLAKRHGVQILAGSIRLPSPFVKEGFLYIRAGNWEERAYIFDSEGQLSESSLLRTLPRESGPYRNHFINSEYISPNVLVANLSFGRIGILFSEDLKSPELEEIVRKTYVSRWVGLGSSEDEGKFREWIQNSSFETSGQAQFSGKAWDFEFPGKSFAKTRYGSTEPSEGQKGNLLINIFF